MSGMLQSWQTIRHALATARAHAVSPTQQGAGTAAAATAVAQHWQQWQAQRHLAAKSKATGKSSAKGAKGKKGAAPTKKKTKQRLETKPLDDKDPHLQRIVAMLVPQPVERPARTPEEEAEADRRARQYSSMRMQAHVEWRRCLVEKLALKKAALAALPPDLRAAAEVEDLAPLPLTRHFYYNTPPAAYKDD